jgi:zinc/manganese transport system substrate-binding protein
MAAAGLFGLMALAPVTARAQRALNVVATTPDLAALAREIGGTAVDVKTLAKPTEDPHFVDPKPSLIVTLNRADVLIHGGAELEAGWLPPLLESARNKKIAAGTPGQIIATSGITMLEIPVALDRSKGDVHAHGNPHFLMDPLNAIIVAENIANHFAKVDPARAAMFKTNFTKFRSDVDMKLRGWAAQMLPHKGAKVVTYHNDFIYFAERFGLKVAETLEPKPGLPPSAAHLAKVIASMKAETARVIMVQPYQSRRTAETVARQTNAAVLDVSQQPGAMKNTDTYIALMDNLVRTVAAALAGK